MKNRKKISPVFALAAMAAIGASLMTAHSAESSTANIMADRDPHGQIICGTWDHLDKRNGVIESGVISDHCVPPYGYPTGPYPNNPKGSPRW